MKQGKGRFSLVLIVAGLVLLVMVAKYAFDQYMLAQYAPDTLNDALARADIETVRGMLRAGADPNELDATGYPPLFRFPWTSSRSVSEELLFLLVDHGADTSVLGITGTIYLEDEERLISMLKQTPDLVHHSYRNSGTPLMLSVELELPNIVEIIINAGADPNEVDDWGIRPLHLAQGEVLSILLKLGANSNVRTHDGDTPLHTALASADIPKIIALLSAGADPMLSAVGERSALQEARYRMRTVTSEELKTLYIQAVELMGAAVAEPEGAKARP